MSESPKIEETLVCPACTLLCDGIPLDANGQPDLKDVGCRQVRQFFQIPPCTESCWVDGKEVDHASAVSATTKLLQAAKSPLITGLDAMTTQAQQWAWKLAEGLGCFLDTSITNKGRGHQFTLAKVGKVTATLGEVVNRSDLLIFWYPDFDLRTLLNRLHRISVDRKFVVITDQQRDCEVANQIIRVPIDQAVTFATVLRLILENISCDLNSVVSQTGVPAETFQELASFIQSSNYGTMVQSTPAGTDAAFDVLDDTLARMVRKLNDTTRFVSFKIRQDQNGLSAENVLAWGSGFQAGICFARGFPESFGLEYSTERLLANRECDAVLLAGGFQWESSWASLSPSAKDHLSQIPKVLLGSVTDLNWEVRFDVGTVGIDFSGEYCRTDNVSLPVDAIHRSVDRRSSEQILESIFRAIDAV
ncbi:MAG: hypothetical protein AAF623_08945 [Planctomycetota bacterium]